MLLEIVAFISCLFLYIFWRDNFHGQSLPPGPTKFPIIGNLLQIVQTRRKLPFEAFDILSKTYGPIMSLKMGMKEINIHGILTKDECSGRILDKFIEERSFCKEQGIIFGNGEESKIIRRVTIQTLKEFGFGKKLSMEATMKAAIADLVDQTKTEISENYGKVKVDLFLNLSVINVLWTMVAGYRFSRHDPRLRDLISLNAKAFKLGNFGSDISIAFPVLRQIFPGITGAGVISECFKELHQYFGEIYKDRKDRGDYSENPQCFVDMFFKKMDQEIKENPSKKIFTEEQFITVMEDLFQTGTETLNGSLSYALLFLILNPKVQEKVQKEIDAIVPDGNITFLHKPNLIYTEATILEVLRLGNIVPLVPPRKVLKDFKYKGYEFKKGMTVIANLYSVISSESNWGDPENFRPERFIGANGRLCNTERVAAFGFGKRFCMGESMASSAMFLFLTTMLKHFRFKKVPNQADPRTEPLPAFTLAPQPFDMIVEIR